MEKKTVLQLARDRRSVRTFDGSALTAKQVSLIGDHIAAIRDPFRAGVSFRLLDADEHGLSSPVLKGARQFIAICAKKGENADLGAGYAGEDLILFLTSLGLGTVWIGGTMDRAAFEKAAGLKEDEVMPCITPLGVPARMSMRESLMRKGVKADQRLPLDEIFSDREDIVLQDAVYRDALEAVRLAPSAVNKQPWRIIHDRDGFHFFLKRSLQAGEGSDMQKVDMGIALCHFLLSLKEAGRDAQLISDSDHPQTEDEYIATVR